MADFSKEVSKDLKELKTFMMSSFSAFIKDQQESNVDQLEALFSIADALKADGSKSKGSSGRVGVGMLFGNMTNFFKNLSDLSKNVKDMSKSLKGFQKVPTEEFTVFLYDFVDAITLKGKMEDPKKLGKFYKYVGMSFSLMGIGISRFSKGMMMFSLVNKTGAPLTFMVFAKKFFSRGFLKNLKIKRATRIGSSLSIIGQGIMRFSTALLLAGPMLALAAPGLLVAFPVILGVIKLFSLMNKFGLKKARRAGHALAGLGRSLLMFSMSIAGAGVFLALGIPSLILAIPVLLLTLGVVKIANKIGGVKSSANLIMLGMAIGILGLGFAAFNLVQPKAVLVAGMAAIVISGFAIASLFMTPTGAISLGLMAVAVAGVGLSMLIFNSVKPKTVLVAAASLGLVSAIGLLLGATFPIGILGALTLVALGGALLVFSFGFNLFINGLAKFKDSGWNSTDTEVLKGTILGLMVGIGEAFRGGGIIGGLKTFVSGGAGIAMLAGLGPALALFAFGLKKFKGVGWTSEDSEHLEGTFHAVTAGLLKNTEGINAKTIFNATTMVSSIGRSLKVLSKGLKKFRDSMTMEEIVDVSTKASLVVGILAAKFASFGSDDKKMLEVPIVDSNGKVTGDVYRVNFKSAKRGVVFVKKIGNSLDNVAKGLVAWNDGLPMEDIVSIANKSSLAIGIVAAKFASFAGEDKKMLEVPMVDDVGNIIPGQSMKVHFKSAKRGVDFVERIGGALTSISEGLKSWATGIDFTTIGEVATKAASVVGIVASKFADFASENKKELRIPQFDENGNKIGYTTVHWKSAKRGTEFAAMAADALYRTTQSLKDWDTSLPLDTIAKQAGKVSGIIGVVAGDFALLMADKYKHKAADGSKTQIKVKDAEAGVKKVEAIGKMLGNVTGFITTLANQKIDLGQFSVKFNQFNMGLVGTFVNLGKSKDDGGAMKSFGDKMDSAKSFLGVLNKTVDKASKFQKIESATTKISKNIAGMVTSINDLDSLNVDSFKSFFDNLVEIDRIDVVKFKKNIQEVESLIEKLDDAEVDDSVNEAVESLTDAGSQGTSGSSDINTEEMLQEMKDINGNLETLWAKMDQVANALNGVLTVKQR